jgi:hypothetical protein
MAKGQIEFKTGKGNCDTYLDTENALFYIRVDLNATELPVSKNSGNEMMAKGFFNLSHDDKRIFGNLNLNIGKNKAALKDENTAMAARIAELEAKLAE